MTTRSEPNDPAFPSQTELYANGDIRHDGHWGLSTREYFAAKALQGMSANPNFFGPLFQQNPVAAAQYAVQAADALLAELAKQS